MILGISPIPTRPDPPKTFDKFGLGWDDPIILEASVEKIKEFIINGGATKEIIYAFPNKIFGILELKRKGTYITPKYEDRNKI